MKTKLISVFVRGLVFAALAVAVAPRTAAAQVTETGEFTLPFEVQWGAVVLPAGAYRFSVGDVGPSNLIHIYMEGRPSTSCLILPVGWDTMPASSEKDQLLFDRKAGEVYVKELQLGSVGLALHYRAPKLK